MNLNQCVPNWDLEEPPNSNSNRLASHVPIMGKEPRPDGEVTELTWKNGNPSMHGLGHTPVAKPVAVARWQKPQLGSGTLEAVVDQATAWLGGPQKQGGGGRKRARAAAEEESRNCMSQGSRKSVGITDTCHLVSAEDAGGGFTTTSATQSPVEDGGSPETENGSFIGGGGGLDNSACQSKRSLDETGEEEKLTKVETGISSISTKRSRAASVHNQSERKRRDRINQKMRTLQKLVPNSGKTDKASMLDEVIDYLKQLQAQVQMMNRMSSIPPMMMPMSMQQFQISMMAQMAQMVQMAQMGMGMGLGMGMMDLGPLGRPGLAPMAPSIIPTTSAFVPFTGADQSQQFGTQSTVAPDTFLASAQPPGMDAYNRMAALYQQLHQQPPPSNTKP